MNKYPRQTITQAFQRVARDCNYTLSGTEVAQFVARLLNLHPFDVYSAIGSLDTMNSIATGNHPACGKRSQ